MVISNPSYVPALASQLAVKVADVLHNSNDAEKSTGLTAYTKLKEIKLNQDIAFCRLKYDYKTGANPYVATVKSYKNGVAMGTEQTDNTGTYSTFSEDFSAWLKDDLIQIYGKISAIDAAYVKNMRLYYQIEITDFDVTNQDP